MTNTANYQPREGSVPARLIAHLKEKGCSITSSEIATLMQIERKNVDNNLAAAVAHGALKRDGQHYFLPLGTATRPVADLQDAWGGGAKPAFPAAPPRAVDPPPKVPKVRKMRTLKDVAQTFHRAKADSAIATVAPLTIATTAEPASLRQIGGTHYKQMAVQPWDVVDDWPLDQRIGYYRGNALKYLMRMGSKDQDAQEIGKGRHYIEKLLEVLQEQDLQVAAA